MIEPGRKFVQGVKKYRYSINTQEKETELNQNITTAEYWEYDSRIGRRWNVDPVLKVYESPYLAFAGNPIWISDPLGNDTTPASSKSIRDRMKSLREDALKEYQGALTIAAKYNAEERKKPLVNLTAAVTIGSSFSLKGKILGVGAGLNGTIATDLDLIGVRDNQGVILGTNMATGEKPRKMFDFGINYGGFGYSADVTRDANTSSFVSYSISDKNAVPYVFKNGALITTTEKLEMPFHTWENKTVNDANTGKVIKSTSSSKTPLIHIKAAAFIGVELNLDINSKNYIIPPYPLDPYKVRIDETRIKPFIQPILKKKP